MRPEPPTNYRATLLERIGLGRIVPNIARMILRQLERHWVKTSLSVVAVATSVGVIVVGNFMADDVDYFMDTQFYEMQAYDLMATTSEPVSADARFELENIAGVQVVEPVRTVACRIGFGHRSRRVAITGLQQNATLFRLAARDGSRVTLPPGRSGHLPQTGRHFGGRSGRRGATEVLERKRPQVDAKVVATVDDMTGLNAWIDLDALRGLLQDGDLINAFHLQTDASSRPQIYQEMKQIPQLVGVSVKESSLHSFEDTIGKNMMQMRAINLTFAIIIAVGVVYNGAMISLSERSRELATLRVIGFTRGEISAILLGEIGTVTFLAIPLGLLIGYWFSVLLWLFLDQEMFRFPLYIERSTFGLAAAVVMTASVTSALYVRRRLDHLDLIAVLKARD